MPGWRPRFVPVLLLAFAAAGPVAAQETPKAPAPVPAPAGGGPAAQPSDRFFQKDLDDALRALDGAVGDEESSYEALFRITRMLALEGSADPLKQAAFGPVFRRAVETRQDTFADTAGTFLAALDRPRLAAELKKAAEAEKDPVRLRAMTFLAEDLGAPKGVEILAGPLASSTAREVRVRVVEALGILRAEQGIPIAMAAMRDPDFEVRNAAALALGHIGDKKGEGALLADLGELKGNQGWFCAEALGLIEDPTLFDQILNYPAGGASGGPRAKAFENCARPANVETLIGVLQKGTSGDMRTAAANALGRFRTGADAPVGPGESANRPKIAAREDVADALLEGIASDKEPPVRAACFFALRKCATELTGAKAQKRLNVQGDDKILYLLTILGERKVVAAAQTLLRSGILGAKQAMIRRASGVAYWQLADPGAAKEFRDRIFAAEDAGALERLCEALGSWRSKEGFETALQLMRTTREGSREQFSVMLALEKMTGHYFGPSPGIWNKWFEKNPNFFTPKQERIEREKWREEFDKENQGFRQTKETEKAVQMGLGWLARHQGFDGIWDSTGFLTHCDPKNPCSKAGGGRTQFSQAGTTGLPCLALMGAGYSPAAGKFRHTIRRGLESLLATMTVEGDFDQADYLWHLSYGRPIAMQALAEGFAGSGDERYRYGAERILAREFSLMNERGGWRYAVQREVPEVDSSVTAWVVFATKACEKAGIAVPRLLWEGPYLAFESLSKRVPQSGPFEEFIQEADAYGVDVGKGKAEYLYQSGYQDANGGPSRATTPIGLMSHILLGWRRTHPFCIGSANYIVKNYLPAFEIFGEPGKEDWSKVGRFAPKSDWTMYNYYYCTLAMHQMGGTYFRDWNRRISRFLPFVQKKEGCERGSWAGWNVDGQDGWIYSTCMGALTLETYYRYAPILAD
jgi:HEAT repeat protein